jgi:uncharacterized protein (TIGR03437 family)
MRVLRFAGLLLLAPAAWAQSELTITTTSVPNGVIGVSYSASISSNAISSAQWEISGGSLPPGISLTGASGPTATISGTPTTAGTYSFTAEVAQGSINSVGYFPQTASRSFSLTIAAPPIIFSTTSPLPNAMAGVSYDTQLSASGGIPPLTFSALTVPPGLQLSSGGSLSGIPTAASNYSFNVTATDGKGNTASVNFSIDVTAALVFGTASPLPAGTAGAPYSETISVSGGTMPYVFSIPGTSPPGINITKSGNVAGTPTAIGTYTFTVQVTDSNNFTATKSYSVTINAGAPLLQVSPLSLVFTYTNGGDLPLPQAISIVSTNSAAVPFAITIDAGTAGGAAPPWVTVTPVSGSAPARLLVSVNPTLLPLMAGQATIHVGVAGNTAQAPVNVTVGFAVNNNEPILQTIPTALNFAARFDAPGSQQRSLILDNVGGNSLPPLTASIVGNSPWLTVTPTSTKVANGAVAVLQVQVNSTGLAVGDHHDIIQISGGNPVQVPVDVFVSASGPIISLAVNGVRFQSRQGNGSSRPQSVLVLNLGDTTSIVDWTATLLTGSDWLTLTTSSGTATPAQPGVLTMVPNSSVPGDPAGPRYALVQVTDKDSLNSPQYLAAVLDNEPSTTLALPDPSPVGLYFTSKTGPQQVLVYTSASTQTPFETSAVTNDGSPWLAVTPASGVATTNSPGQLTVSVTPPATAGIYTGYINIGMDGELVLVNVTLVVLPAGATGNQPSEHPAASPMTTASCTPTQLAMTETGIVNNFSVPAGWPATLIAQLNDNCGNAVSNGSIVASFSTGDAPLPLAGTQTSNTYSATWQPGAVYPSMSITLRASAGTLPPLTQLFTGSVNNNPTPPPVLLPNGTLDIFFTEANVAALGAGLAPGNVVQVYGSGLGPSLEGAPGIPLPTAIDGTYMLVGQYQAPLYFISASPLAAEIPFELTPNQQYSAIASVNNALSLPITVTVVPVQPGIAVRTDGTAEAQHTADYSLVTTANPAKPGETVVIYLAGMGATDPSVASGAPTPPQLVPTVVQPTVTLDSQNVTIGYAGLTPSGIGLYQIDFVIPANARSGNLNVIVTQNGVVSNTAILPVSN